MRSLTDGLEESAPSEGKSEDGGGIRETLNDFASGVGGKILLALVAVGMLAFLFSRYQSATGPAPETMAPGQVRILNPLTGEVRWHTLSITRPGLPDGYYNVEYCWNDHNGDGVPVILNAVLYDISDPRRSEPTSCPCCGAEVVGHNPKPEEFVGMTPSDFQTGRADPCVVDHYSALLGG